MASMDPNNRKKFDTIVPDDDNDAKTAVEVVTQLQGLFEERT